MSIETLLCPKEKLINEITSDRYSFYQSNLNKQCPIWSEELNAWMIFDYKLIKKFLGDKRFTANRKKGFIKELNLKEDQEKVLSLFYSRWLMYMEGPNHTQLRKKVQIPINKSNVSISPIARDLSLRILDNISFNSIIDVEEKIAGPFVCGLLSNLLGLNQIDYCNILRHATSAVEFLWNPNPSEEQINKTITSIKQTHDIISDIIRNNRYEKDRLLDYVIESVGINDESLALIINIAVDGHEPFVSAIKSYVYMYLSYFNQYQEEWSDVALKNIVEKSLRLKAPFPYCARNALEDINIENKLIKSGQRVIFFISSGNIDYREFENSECPFSEEHPSKSLTFGVGSHYCLGAVITRKSIEEFAYTFNQYVMKNLKISIINSEWKDTFGFRTLENFTIKIMKNN